MADQDFFERVYDVTRRIPYGRVTSYGAIAKFLGAPRSARMVGYALNASTGMDDVPAQRVVNRNGLLSGKHHFGGSHLMEELLRSEGVTVEDDQVQRLVHYFWDPSEELKRQDYLP